MKTAENDAIAKELERLELLLMDPAVRRDHERVASLLAEDFLEIGSSGRVWTREILLEQLQAETFSPPVIEEFACRMLGADAALVTYRTVRRNEPTGERKITLRSSIWTRAPGDWKMRFHQGTQTSAEPSG